MVAWEYKIVTVQNFLSEIQLNEFGQDGWQLTSVVKDYYVKSVGPDSSIKLDSFVYYFKRPMVY